MIKGISRRQAIKLGMACGTVATLGSPRRLHAAPRATIESTTVISRQPHLYHGWPTVVRRQNGQLRVVWSGGRESHVCPFGRVESMVSNDDGATWTWPRVLLDSALDDRDAGILETGRGTLLVTTFTSLAYDDGILEPAEKRLAASGTSGLAADQLERWRAARDRLTKAQRQAQLGSWMLRSTDGGITWSSVYDCHVDSPHGPVQLSGDRLLYAGKNIGHKPSEPSFVGVYESVDDGPSWRRLAAIPPRPGDHPDNYHELHAVETSSGRIIAHIRNHNKTNAGETLQSESTDGGKTWSTPHSIGVWGLPSHLLRLRDDRLLMSYGHRRPPFGNQARISVDNGSTWSDPIIISGDGAGGDLGYPSTVELADGAMLTIWYESMKGAPKAVLRQARWRMS